LPIPAAANLVAATVLAQSDLGWSAPEPIMLGLLFALGILMVSGVRYRSFKDFDLRHRRSFFLLVLMVALLAFVVIRPELALCVLFAYYVAWGPVRELIGLLRRTTDRKRQLSPMGPVTASPEREGFDEAGEQP
jgi:CDP-diacylglycerol--serine O-phosphatidyltransferase